MSHLVRVFSEKTMILLRLKRYNFYQVSKRVSYANKLTPGVFLSGGSQKGGYRIGLLFVVELFWDTFFLVLVLFMIGEVSFSNGSIQEIVGYASYKGCPLASLQ